VLAVHERQSRILFATRPPNKAAEPVAEHLLALFQALPANLRRTVTFDNGTEFARHLALHGIDVQTFFCDPYAPWQKGGIENAIGRMRHFIPRKTDLARLSEQRFQTLLSAYNNTPRKCLDFATPREMFHKLLHFECESTSPLKRGRFSAGMAVVSTQAAKTGKAGLLAFLALRKFQSPPLPGQQAHAEGCAAGLQIHLSRRL
jgi:IS30 family transposase